MSRPKSPIPLAERRKIYRANLLKAHPGYILNYNRKWREKNWELDIEHRDKNNAKFSAKRTKFRILKHAFDKAKREKGNVSIEKEIAHHLARGRDAGRIAVWMEIPISVVLPIIQKIQQSKL